MHTRARVRCSKFSSARFFLLVGAAATMLLAGLVMVALKHFGVGCVILFVSLGAIVVFSHPMFLEKSSSGEQPEHKPKGVAPRAGW